MADGEPVLNIPSEQFLFRSTAGLELEATTTADSEVFTRFYSDYDRAFVLPDEKEAEEGFVRCLELNQGSRHAELSRSFGPFREVCAVARTGPAESVVGGANFIAIPTKSTLDGRPIVTANLNYVFVNSAWRGRGLFRPLINSVRELICQLFRWSSPTDVARDPHTLVFIEQNDPFRLSPEDYRRDTEHSGLDQLDRLRIWAKLGARVVDFAYVQPALSPLQQPDPNLIYSVLGAASGALEASLLAHHLRVFFGVSVLKGQPPEAQPVVARQLTALEAFQARHESIALLDPLPLLTRLTRETFLNGVGPPDSFRHAIGELSRDPKSTV